MISDRRSTGLVAAGLVAAAGLLLAPPSWAPRPAAAQVTGTAKPAPTPAAPAKPAGPDQKLKAEQENAFVTAKGLKWLVEMQQPDGGWECALPSGRPLRNAQGLLFLVNAGAKMEDKSLQQALAIVCAPPTTEDTRTRTLVMALRLQALLQLWPQLPQPMRRKALDDVRDLCAARFTDGSWRAVTSDSFTTTWAAMWTLYEASQVIDKGELKAAGLTPELWAEAAAVLLAGQLPEGGWDAGRSVDRAANLPNWGCFTAASTACLLAAREQLQKQSPCLCKDGRTSSNLKPALAAKCREIEAGIERGLGWLDKNFTAVESPGGGSVSLWAMWLQRVGQVTGLSHFAGKPWREPLRLVAVRGCGNTVWAKNTDTLYTILEYAVFVDEWPAAAPLVTKVRFEGSWYTHLRDAANLTDYISLSKEARQGRKPPAGEVREPVGWRSAGLDVPLNELLETPLLYLSAESKVTLTAEQRQKLRQFTDAGGTVLLEAGCGNSEARADLEKLCRETWPEWTAVQLRTIDRDHPLWTAEEKMAKQPVLFGLDDGLRTFVFFSRADLSTAWQNDDRKINRASFDLGANLSAYAMAGLTLADWRAARERSVGAKYADQVPKLQAGPKKKITVARLKHTSDKLGGEWSTGLTSQPWQTLAADLAEKFGPPAGKVVVKDSGGGFTLQVLEPVDLGAGVPAGVDLLYMCGRSRCALGEAEAAQLKKYLSAGGFLFAEAALGDRRFGGDAPAGDAAKSDPPAAEAAGKAPPLKALLATVGLELRPMEAGNPLVTGELFEGTVGYQLQQVGHTPMLQHELAGAAAGAKAETAKAADAALCGIYDGKKLVGLYSPYDIMFSQTGGTAWGNRGYAPDDARALATNLVLLLSAR